MRVLTVLPVLALCSLAACTSTRGGTAPQSPVAGIGDATLRTEVVMDGLNNPSFVSFAPDGALTVCDTGNGRVLVRRGGETIEWVSGMTTEYWKVDKATGEKRYELGPLAAVWVGDTLAVTDAGLLDGMETIRFYDAPGGPHDGCSTNSVPPTTYDPADGGEGNLCGLSVSPCGRWIYVAGQGSDAMSWVLRCDTTTGRLKPFLSADAEGITVNSPMQTLPWHDGTLLVLYSGAGGKEDGLLVQWSIRTGKPLAQWTLPGLADPMGMDRIPGTDELAVVDNRWSLTAVGAGRLGRVRLTPGGGEADVEILADQLQGPVACAFGPDGRLYVTTLGTEFDKGLGQVLAISGVR